MNNDQLTQRVAELPKLPKPDIRIDAFGDIMPTDGRKFIMGNFYSAEQMIAAQAPLIERIAELEGALRAIDSLRGPFMPDAAIAAVWAKVDAALASSQGQQK